MNNSLSQHLNESINEQKRVDESLVLGAIVATTCLTYAVAPVLNTDFMKSVGDGLESCLVVLVVYLVIYQRRIALMIRHLKNYTIC